MILPPSITYTKLQFLVCGRGLTDLQSSVSAIAYKVSLYPKHNDFINETVYNRRCSAVGKDSVPEKKARAVHVSIFTGFMITVVILPGS